MPARASKAPYHRMRVNVTHQSMQQLFNWAYTSIHKFHMRRIHTMISKLPGYVHRQLLYQGGTSLVPHLVGPPCHWFPISLVPISLVPHNIGPPINTHPPPIPLPPNWSPPDPLIPHVIGPLVHKSPSLYIYCLNPLVPLLIGLAPYFIHRPVPTAFYHTDPPFSTHAPPFPLVPHLLGRRKGFFIGSISMVPHVTLVTQFLISLIIIYNAFYPVCAGGGGGIEVGHQW